MPRTIPAQFRGKSANGIYGDWVEEVDWSVGRVLDKVKELKLDENTLVLFTSDNGGTPVASNAPLRRFQRQHVGRRHARTDYCLVAGKDCRGFHLRRDDE